MRPLFCVIGFLLLVASARADALRFPLPACENKISCARHSVVSVFPIWPVGQKRSDEPEGSGVVVDSSGLIATADHVLGSATSVFVRTVSGEVLEAKIALRDASTDVALLRVARTMKPLPLSDRASVGSRVCAAGNSFGLDVSVACGVISAVQVSGAGFNRIEDFVQTDAAVNPGMSGGALVNSDGELVGVLSAIFTKKSDSNIGVNFAVSAPLLRRLIAEFSDTGSVDWLQPGLLVKPALKNGEAGLTGAKVVRIKEESAEARGGIVLGDVILFAGSRRIKREGAYAAALALLRKGDSLALDILRKGKREKIVVEFDQQARQN